MSAYESTFIRRIIAQLSALLDGERVHNLTLADLGSADEARALRDTLSRKVRVASIPTSPVWEVCHHA